MSEKEDCKACETIFAAHPDERPAVLLLQLNALHSKYTLHVAGHVLAAAEERGRRRGVEEAATAIDAKRAATQGDDTFTTYYRGGLADAARIVRAAIAPRDSLCGFAEMGFGPCVLPRDHDGTHTGASEWAKQQGYAPRDSASVCDAVVSSDPFREWRCGKQKGHAGPHSGEAPRDSGKET